MSRFPFIRGWRSTNTIGCYSDPRKQAEQGLFFVYKLLARIPGLPVWLSRYQGGTAMKKTLVSLSLCAMLSQPALAAFQTGSGLLAQCTSRDNSQFAQCATYLKASVDVLEELGGAGNLKGEKFCGLNRASVGQLSDVFITEAKMNPKNLTRGASLTVLSAYRKAFACAI